MAANNETVVSGWVSSPEGRGTFPIIISCLFTIILCCWTSVCPNLPALSDSRWNQLKDKLDLACIGVLGPEFLLGIAVGQRVSARRSLKKFSEAGYSDWTLTHAFFADMGGFVLEATDLSAPIPMNSNQLLYLIQHSHVNYPGVSKADINDKSKADRLARLLTLCQALWFTASLITRPIQGLAMTTLELTTASFIIVMLGTSYFWLHKPSDVSTPIILPCLSSITEIRREAGLHDPQDYQCTPLDFIGIDWFDLDLVWRFYINILRLMHINLFSRPIRSRPHNRIRGDQFLSTELDMEILSFCFILGFCGSFLCAWNFYFPTPVERLLWRIASAYTLAFGLFGGFYVAAWHHKISDRYHKKDSSTEQTRNKKSSNQIRDWVTRDVTSSSDSQLKVPLGFLVPITFLSTFYCVARGYILVEDIIGLRILPKSAFSTVQWTTYLPHI